MILRRPQPSWLLNTGRPSFCRAGSAAGGGRGGGGRGHSHAAPALPVLLTRAASAASPAPRRPRTAIFFPGQGVQRVGMATPWLESYPRTAAPILEEIDSILGFSLSRIISEGPNATLTATENAQPAIMATSILILRVLESEFGFSTADRVDFTLGHSLGEFAALVAGGYLHFADALYLVRKRAEVMANVSQEAIRQYGGEVGMVALICEDETHLGKLVEHIYDFIHLSSPGAKHDSAESSPPVEQVTIANINSKNQIVLSGSLERIDTLLKHLRSFGGHDPRHHRLKADSPFHSPLLKPAQEAMERMLAAPSPFSGKDMITFPALMPCISNVSAHPMKSAAQIKDHLSRQCVETVYWRDSIRYLDREQTVRRWLGIGPGHVGRNLVGKEVGMKGAVKGGGVWGITSPKEIEAIVRALDDTEQAEED